MRPTELNPFFRDLTDLAGVGTKTVRLYQRLLGTGQDTPRVVDLLFHLPVDVLDRRARPEIATAPHGAIATLSVRVGRHEAPKRRGAPYRVFAHDETGELALVFFRAQPDFLRRLLTEGETRIVSGKLEWYGGRPQMVHPDHVVAPEDEASLPAVEPIYPLSEGLTGRMLGKTMAAALASLPDLPEWQDPSWLARRGFPSFREALVGLHTPSEPADLASDAPARLRLAYDELLSGQLALALIRRRIRKQAGKERVWPQERVDEIRAALPFALTNAQTEALTEIADDLKAPHRMLRLLQGDVGSGKTAVALITIAMVVTSGAQAALMAPTALLARQHFEAIAPMFARFGISCRLMIGSQPAAERAEGRRGLAEGSVDVAIGTHAMFQDDVAFHNLGLVVVDEQHRFGVHQRLALSDKGPSSDVLVMTATPIPRTLVLTTFGDMDVSRLTEKPPGRTPVDTRTVPLDRIDDVAERLEAAIARGEKAYWICPLVEESDVVDLTSVTDRHARLTERLGDSVGLVHGKMKPADRDAVMARFRDGDIKVLVATTVVEVGVDVPDATIMVIEHAERFGLAQLHQLRGRVGRGKRRSVCLLLYKAPIGETAKGRLSVMRDSEDGFLIAEEDLRLRGEGEILGTRQSGLPGFHLAVPELQGELIAAAHDDARLVIETDPELTSARGKALRLLLYLFERDEAVRLLRAG
ncbi:ATP-dependent DNA helicase RecG [Amorphus orientalis]|uniref:Probable DNA 3'-5' helicase RecG n=1 Tax=Amorphus orientalis TaxID=649198 RepID=A0AAE3VPI8_9HYPH|nr:ATP-dependent DNA helicase RecG [Amorphus orientalis]MDQ0315663.1 ATP-dependent DNA helicase RecG [Amorphus orientalis]